MAVRQELSNFIRSTFRSVWSLELLRFLRRHRDRAWTHDQLIDALRASDLVVRQSLGLLHAAGLIVLVGDQAARYQPVSKEVDHLVVATEELYAKRPDLVRRLIVTAGSDSLTNFANAFKLRED